MLKSIFDFLEYILFRVVMFILQRIPKKYALSFMIACSKFLLKKRKYYNNIVLVNLKIAYPEKTDEWRYDFIDKIATEFAKTFYDVVRLPKITTSWIHSHITLENAEFIKKFHEKKIPVIYATGHLGSFELLIHTSSLLTGNKISIVVRSFKNKLIDKYWNNLRQRFGSEVIRKEGAYKSSVRAINRYCDLGFPFDQNAKKGDAIFVDFFGKKAATSKTLGVLALRHHMPIILAYTKRLDDDNFIIKTKECIYEDIYNDEALSKDEKIYQITTRATKIFEEYVREFPEGWFWMHRRWKTRPEGEERFY